MFFRFHSNNPWHAPEIGLARGKQEWDKRETLKRKQDARETARALSDDRKRMR